MDIMLGNWVCAARCFHAALHAGRRCRRGPCAQAAQNLGSLDAPQLAQFSEVLDMENPDLFKMLTGQEAIPDEARCAPIRHATPRSPPSPAVMAIDLPARLAASWTMRCCARSAPT